MTATVARPNFFALLSFSPSRTFLAFLFLLFASPCFAGQVPLAWNASTSPDVAGYMVHYGQVSGSYSSAIDVGNKTSVTVPNLQEGKKYYFSATAYDPSRTESPFSNEASTTIPYSVPAASFSASKTSGAAPLGVTFSSTSTGTVSSYEWTFGDGASSTAQNPTHSYAAKGTYTVVLKVTGPGGSNTLTKSGYITVSAGTTPPPPPVPSFSASKTSGPAPLAVTFTSTSTGTISSYAWTFGDGAGSTAQNPSHSYATKGTYAVVLKVTGPGGSNTLTKSGYITVSAGTTPPPPPVPGFSASKTSGPAPLAVTFTSTSTGAISSYAWTFGDGATSTAQNPTHSYLAAGNYTVTLKVTGPGGSNTSTKSGYISVSGVASSSLFANFSVAKLSGATAPLVVKFTSTSFGSVSSYAWDFGDGGTSTAQTPTHTYATLGSHKATLKVTGPSGQTATVTKVFNYY